MARARMQATCYNVRSSRRGWEKAATGNLCAVCRKQINAALNAVTLPAIRVQVDPFDWRVRPLSPSNIRYLCTRLFYIPPRILRGRIRGL